MPYDIDEKPLSILSLIELRAKKVLPGQECADNSSYVPGAFADQE